MTQDVPGATLNTREAEAIKITAAAKAERTRVSGAAKADRITALGVAGVAAAEILADAVKHAAQPLVPGVLMQSPSDGDGGGVIDLLLGMAVARGEFGQVATGPVRAPR